MFENAIMPVWVVLVLTVINVGIAVFIVFTITPLRLKLGILSNSVQSLVERVTSSNTLVTHATETVRRMTGQFKDEAEQIRKELGDADTIIRTIGDKADHMIQGVSAMEQEGVELEARMEEIRPKGKRKKTP